MQEVQTSFNHHSVIASKVRAILSLDWKLKYLNQKDFYHVLKFLIAETAIIRQRKETEVP